MMQTNKNHRSNLESRKMFFFFLGLSLALGAAYAALQWRSYERSFIQFDLTDDTHLEEPAPPRTAAYTPPIPVQPNPSDDPKAKDIIDIFIDVPDPTVGDSYLDTLVDIDPWPDSEIPTIIITAVQKKPVFQGCEKLLTEEERFECFNQNMITYVGHNFKIPAEAAYIKGRMFVTFIIDENGRITKPEVVRSLHPDLDAEAVRVLLSTPKMQPAMQNGRAVRVQYTIPISISGK